MEVFRVMRRRPRDGWKTCQHLASMIAMWALVISLPCSASMDYVSAAADMVRHHHGRGRLFSLFIAEASLQSPFWNSEVCAELSSLRGVHLLTYAACCHGGANSAKHSITACLTNLSSFPTLGRRCLFKAY
eukprot:2682974-Amphidinium_carterae.1